MLSPPNPDVLEFTILGPSFGESIVIHLGDGNWMIVDSCLDEELKSSAPLKYLRDLKVDVAIAVKLIVVTHWHSDHVAGISETIEACVSAEVCVSPIYDNEQFAEEIYLHTTTGESRIGSALGEVKKVLGIRDGTSSRIFKAATPDRNLRAWSGSQLSHGRDIVVYTLSPSDMQLRQFISKLATLASPDGKVRGRARVPRPNESSVVVWIQIGELAMLLGADLEEVGPLKSWSAILASTGRPQTKAQIFKIPHHGSVTAYHPDVWTEMLQAEPIAVVTPWVVSSHYLPKTLDLRRIRKHTNNGYLTSLSRPSQYKATSKVVDRTLREMGRPIVQINQRPGYVTVRNGGRRKFADWTVSLSREARAI